MSDTPIIEVQHLTKRFKGLTAVNDVSFSIREGGITGMIGPNGAGKSTTFNMICPDGRQDLLPRTGYYRQAGL